MYQIAPVDLVCRGCLIRSVRAVEDLQARQLDARKYLKMREMYYVDQTSIRSLIDFLIRKDLQTRRPASMPAMSFTELSACRLLESARKGGAGVSVV